MSSDNLDAVNLAAVPVDGTIHEDLMNKIFDVSPMDLPFTDMIAKGTSTNFKKDWVRENLAAANPLNKRIDGSDSTGNDTRVGERLSNYHQILSKIVRVSDRGQDVDTVGGDELIKQIMKRGREIRRDLESSLTSRNIAIAGDGDTIEGQLAGLGGWIGTGQAATNTDRGVGGADPILSGDPGGFPTTAAVAGTARALSETSIKDVIQAAYLKGGNPTVLMSTPAAIQVLSDYLFTSSARVATLQTDVSQGNRVNNESGGGRASGGVVAQGSVNVLVNEYYAIAA